MVMLTISATEEPPPESPLGLAATENPKKPPKLANDILSIIPYIVVVIGVGAASAAYTSVFYRRQMANIRLEEQEKALSLVKQKYNQIAGMSGMLSTVTAMLGYGICSVQSSRKKQPKKKKSKTKVKSDKTLTLK